MCEFKTGKGLEDDNCRHIVYAPQTDGTVSGEARNVR